MSIEPGRPWTPLFCPVLVKWLLILSRCIVVRMHRMLMINCSTGKGISSAVIALALLSSPYHQRFDATLELPKALRILLLHVFHVSRALSKCRKSDASNAAVVSRERCVLLGLPMNGFDLVLSHGEHQICFERHEGRYRKIAAVAQMSLV